MNKPSNYRLTLVLIVSSLVSSPVLARRQAQTRSRGLAVEDNAYALSVKVYKAVREAGGITKAGGALNLADPNLAFRSGELITVSYSLNFDGYLYFVNVGPEGTRVIFPASDAGTAIAANTNHDVTLRLNEYTGREELVLVVSWQRLPRLDDAIRSSSKMLDQQTTNLSPATNNAPQSRPNSPSFPGQGDASSPGILTADQPGPKKESRRKQVGIIAGGIAMELLSRWLNPSSGGSAGASGGFPLTRGLEVEQSDNNAVRAYPSPGENGNGNFGAGQVAAFRISFDHR